MKTQDDFFASDDEEEDQHVPIYERDTGLRASKIPTYTAFYSFVVHNFYYHLWKLKYSKTLDLTRGPL